MAQSRVHGGPPGEKSPKDPRAFLQLAEEHRRNGRLKEAIAVCLDGLGRHPGLDAARITLGRAYLESDQPEIARATLEEVFGRLPEHHLAGKLLAEAQQRLGDMTAAEATCRSLLQHYPRDREIEAILESVTSREAPAGEASAVAPVAEAATDGAAAAPVAAGGTVAAPAATGSDAAASAEADPEPEYMPEDVDLKPRATTAAPHTAATPSPASGTPAGSQAAVTPTPPASRTQAGSPTAAPAGDALQTSTLADLYLRQGLVDRAIEVYRAMLRVDPGNQRARQRLAEIESGVVPPATPAATPAARPVATPTTATSRPQAVAAAMPAREPVAPTPGPAPAPGDDARRQAMARLEEWLDTIHRGSSEKKAR